MKNKSLIRVAATCLALTMAFTPVNASAAALLKKGSRGTEVKTVQTTLQELGFFTYPKTTGYYGKITEDAVKRFQKVNGLKADGVIGKKTRSILLEDTVEIKTAPTYGDLDWFSEVRDLWDRGVDATVTDVDTGKSFQVRRTYGTNHADVEPLTKEDTQTIKEIWDGFSWERRAVVVQVGEYVLAASMTAMPHAGKDKEPAGRYISGRSQGYGWGYNYDVVKNNGANGVMDIHFKNSRTHTTNVKQKSMQDMVKKAAEYIKKNYQLET